MCDNVHECPDNDGPCCRFVKGDVLVERDEIVERRTTQQGYEVAANRKENEDDINMENECGGSSNN